MKTCWKSKIKGISRSKPHLLSRFAFTICSFFLLGSLVFSGYGQESAGDSAPLDPKLDSLVQETIRQHKANQETPVLPVLEELADAKRDEPKQSLPDAIVPESLIENMADYQKGFRLGMRQAGKDQSIDLLWSGTACTGSCAGGWLVGLFGASLPLGAAAAAEINLLVEAGPDLLPYRAPATKSRELSTSYILGHRDGISEGIRKNRHRHLRLGGLAGGLIAVLILFLWN